MFEFSPKQRQHQYGHDDDESYALRSPKKIKALKKAEADSGEEVSQAIEPHKAKGAAQPADHIVQLENTVRAAADPILAKVGRSTDDCPWLEHLLQHYSTQSIDQIASAAGVAMAAVGGGVMASVMQAGAWSGALGAISEQVKTSVQHWVTTGKITGVPQDMLNTLPPRLRAELLLAMKSEATVQRKTEEGSENSEANNAEHALGQLEGGGQSLDGDTQGKMEKALGTGLGDVKVHTDGKGAQVAQQNKARAVTVGNHIAFNSGQYQPGTPVGDALLAHELAHTQQQSVGAMTKEEGGGNESALEREADDVAVSAAAGIHGGEESWLKSFGKKTGAALKTGLRLQRCSQEPADEQVNDTVVTDTVSTEKKETFTEPPYTDYILDSIPITSINDIKAQGLTEFTSKGLLMHTSEFKAFTNPPHDLSYGEAMNATMLMFNDMVNGLAFRPMDQYALEAAATPLDEETSAMSKDAVIQTNPAIWNLVKDVKSDFDACADINALETKLIEKSKGIWNAAKGTESDEPVYWARYRMKKVLRENPLLQNNLGEMKRLFIVLEDNSRGRTDVLFDVTAATNKNVKRVLISGFDPYQGGTSNPSGIVAQMLDGKIISHQGEEVAVVEAVTFPTRYSDFDDGVVENFFKPYIANEENNIYMIMTVSLDNDATSMNLDRYAGNIRAGWYENENIAIGIPIFLPEPLPGQAQTYYEDMMRSYNTAISKFKISQHPDYVPPVIAGANYDKTITFMNDFHALMNREIENPHSRASYFAFPFINAPAFIETNFPVNEMLDEQNKPKDMVVHQNYSYLDASGTQDSEGKEFAKKSTDLNESPPADNIKATQGPGGDYLSNEMFYRVSWMRYQYNKDLPNVHLHIPKVGNTQGSGGTFTIQDIYTQAEGILALAVKKQMEKDQSEKKE
ncbi:MAG: hypothetical protein FD123_2800 [Bacteroidetes bacterium]|nr:MAG: hypothetical protein FD123_2800 [Bacteroidota bacterium]